MSEQVQESSPEPKELPLVPFGAPAKAQRTGESADSGSMVAITAILSLAIVTSCCILSCALVTFAFLNNPPW